MPVLVVLMLGLVLGVALGRWSVPDGPGTTAESGRAQLSEGIHRSPANQAPAGRKVSTGARLADCQDVYATQTRVLRAVTPAISRWEVHIGAMNKLVAGAISLAQATEFWNQTRQGAARSLATYADAQRALDEDPARCPTPGSRVSGELQTCAATVAARRRELATAGVALGTWRTHVRHMEMLRRGEMSPGEATRRWLQSWRRGNAEMQAYRSAARDARRVAGLHRHDHGADGPCAG
jgi:hypothetical protein